MPNTNFVTAHYVANPEEPKTPRTVFGYFKPAFLIVEYLATPNTMAAVLSKVFTALELFVVARYPDYHTCRHNGD